jgi:competence protein ComEC
MRTIILSFAGGIFFLQQQGDLPNVNRLAFLCATVCCALLLVFRCRQSLFRSALLVSCAFLCGFVWAAWLAQTRLADQLPEALEGQDVELVGVIAALPQSFERGERFEFAVESVTSLSRQPELHVPQRIMLSWYHGWHEDEWHERLPVRPGERWRLTVRLKRPHGNANRHGFDYEAWLFERNIRATGYVRPRSETQKLDSFVPRPDTAVHRLRDTLRSRFTAALPDAPYLGVLIALTVGDQRAIPNEQWKVFSRSGITHLVSISGLHVTMIAALFAALAGWLWRRSQRLMLALPAQKAAVLVGWLAAFSYALLAGFEVPAQRTLYMLSVVALALWSGRNFAVSRTLLLALLIVLLLDPWAVLAVGFWLSFGAVALLFYVGSARVGSASLGEARGWRAALAQWGATQWAVTVGSLPLLLLFFQQFSLVSPLANALAIPLVSFVITPLALLFAVLPWSPLLYFDHWLMSLLMTFLEWLAHWPVWQQPAPPPWASLLAGLGVLWLLLPRGFPSRWLGLYLILPCLVYPAPRPAAGEAWVEVLDVGQGLAVVVRTAQHALLYDTGPLYSAESDAGQRLVVPYLRATGVTQLDALLVTHADKDHSGGLIAVQDALPIALTLSSLPEQPGERCRAGDPWDWDGVRFTILHPTALDYERSSRKTNNMSCVLRVENAAGSILLTSDIEAVDEQAILARSPTLLASEVLLAPHHGSRTSSTPAFIAAVHPRDVIFPVGYRNRYGHPKSEIVERYAGSRLWRTDRDGEVRITLGNGIQLSAYRQEHRRYWHGH